MLIPTCRMLLSSLETHHCSYLMRFIQYYMMYLTGMIDKIKTAILKFIKPINPI